MSVASSNGWRKKAAGLLGEHLPGLYRAMASRWGRTGRLVRRLERRHGLIVVEGPFADMLYIREARGSRLLPKLIGSYEAELHDAVRSLSAEPFERVVNIGCAEGYYAVGFARRMPRVRVEAFDADPVACRLCAHMAAANGVAARLGVHGLCTHEELNRLDLARALVICDCEGAESLLLDPEYVPGLRTCALLVELHEFAVPGVTDALVRRFKGSHKIEFIEERPRKASDFSALDGWNADESTRALDEDRTWNHAPILSRWLLLRPLRPDSA